MRALRLALIAVCRRWRRNLIAVIVITAGVGAVIVLYSLAVASAEAVTARLDSATRSESVVLLPGAAWDRPETDLMREILVADQVSGAGTLVAPDRTARSAIVQSTRSTKSIESAVALATPSGLRVADVDVRSGGLGSDATIESLRNAVYLGARLAQELDYPSVHAGRVLINGRPFAVLGIIASDDEAWISGSIVLPPESARDAGYLPDQRALIVATASDVTAGLSEWMALTLSPENPEGVTVLTAPSAQELRAEILARGNSLTTLVGLIAALSGLMTLAATTYASLAQRRREIGLYMALGHGRSFVSSQIVVEGTIVGLAGGAVGVLVGALTAAAISAVAYPTFYFSPLLLALVPAAAALGLLSALVPALAATRIAPSELLRD